MKDYYQKLEYLLEFIIMVKKSSTIFRIIFI